MRITVFRNGLNKDGKAFLVPLSWTTLLTEIKSKFGSSKVILFNKHGGIVEDLCLIRDDDVLYTSEGEPFQKPTRQQELLAYRQRHSTHHGRCSDHFMEDIKPEWITLNVGGKYFTTTRSTLTRFDPDSMLARMFSLDSEWHNSMDECGAFLIDRSPLYFEPIINYLRHGKLILDKTVSPEGVLEEARFYGLSSLIETLEDVVEKDQVPNDNTPICRRDLTLRLLSTPTNKELRCQGMNFTGANFSKLDLRHINFKYAVLRNANLAGANLSCCNFERADLCKATIDSAILLGVKMLCANLEATSMKGCYFEDPAGSRANMEGALMKNVDLEGSHMAGVNLRVATLKNANLQNCDLRGAVLAGADLENCDLTGCDLQEANLRGANLKGATFELMLHPLHMAQTVR